jgi:pSer/pThr/pTyr-binding forkhead associated (FHA) protein
MRARLVPLDDAPAIDLTKDLTLVGRGEDCDVRIDHKSVSKLHCLLVKTDGLILVRDLGSTNGTRVNGQRVRRAALLPNDHLGIAAFRYRVKFGDEPEPPPPSADEGSADGGPAHDSDEHSAILDPRPGPVIRRNALPDVYPSTPSAS